MKTTITLKSNLYENKMQPNRTWDEITCYLNCSITFSKKFQFKKKIILEKQGNVGVIEIILL